MDKEREAQNATSAPTAEADHPHAESVEKVLTSLVKLINGKKLYAENNPRLAEFRREFDGSLRKYFGLEDDLSLVVDQFQILWHDQVVYHNEKREESIAFLLHKDGIGEITIGPGAIPDEVNLLVEILADEFYKVVSDEDVVTRFWNADFEHIAYRVLDDYLSGEYAELTSTDADLMRNEIRDHEELLPSLADKGRVIMEPADPLRSIDEYLRRLIMRTCKSSDETERESYFQSMVGSFFSLSNEEVALYREELEREKNSDELADFVEAAFVFTLLRDNPAAVRDISGVLERIFDYAAGEESPTTLGRLLGYVDEFRREQQLPDEISELCDALEARITEPELVAAIGERMIRGETDANETLRYFRLIGRGAVDPLLRVLHHVDGPRPHRDMCDALVEILGDDVVDIIDRFDVDNPLIASDAVYIAGRANVTRLTPSMQELVYYPDRKVKEQMIALVSKMEDDGVVDLLLGAMSDTDKHIRCRAMEAAAERRDPRVKERLHELAFGREFSGFDLDEQEVIFRALGRVGDASTVASIEKMVEKKGLRRLVGNRDEKLLAIRALEGIADPAAGRVLDALSDDSNHLVQSRARRARAARAGAKSGGGTDGNTNDAGEPS